MDFFLPIRRLSLDRQPYPLKDRLDFLWKASDIFVDRLRYLPVGFIVCRDLSTFVPAGLRKGVKVMIGDAPITEDYAKKIGADGFGCDASLAVKAARSLIGG